MRSILIKNATDAPIYVRPHLKGAWKAADSVVGFAEFALGINDLKGAMMAAGLTDLPQTIATFQDIHKVFSELHEVSNDALRLQNLRSLGKVYNDIQERLGHVTQLFKKTALPIEPGEIKDVFSRGLMAEITTPDGIASLLSAKTVTMTILSKDDTKHVTLDSNDATEWIITHAGAFDKRDLHHVHRWQPIRLLSREHQGTD